MSTQSMMEASDFQSFLLKCQKRLIQKAKRQHRELSVELMAQFTDYPIDRTDEWRELLIAYIQFTLTHSKDTKVSVTIDKVLASQSLTLSTQRTWQSPDYQKNSQAEPPHSQEGQRLHSIVSQLNGETYADAANGHFFVSIPLPSPFSADRPSAATVLLADDHSDNLVFIERILSQMGFKVMTASNGLQAVELAMANDFQMIFLDIQMPIMDGLEALELIRATGSDCTTIALTANVSPHDVGEYLNAGFDACLAKPLDRTEFMQLVKCFSEQEKTDPFESLYQSEDFQQMVRGFKRGLKRYEMELLDAFKQRDKFRLAKLSHALKGAGGNFGFATLTQAATTVETQAKSQDGDVQDRDFHHLVDTIRLSRQ